MKRILTTAPLPFALLIGCHSSAPTEQQLLPAVFAEVLTIAPQVVDHGIGISGVVRPRLEADIAAQLTAPIVVITKHEGDHIHRGETLVRLHAPALDAGVTQANAAVNVAEQQSSAARIQAKLTADTWIRYQQLRERHSVTPYELEQMQAQSAAAEAQQKTAAAQVSVAREALAVQRAHAGDAILVAPFDGIVTQRLADPGTLAIPGVPILHMQSTGQTEVWFALPDTSARIVLPGKQLEVSLGSDNSVVKATVTAISPAGDASSHSFSVKASLPQSAPWNTGTVVSISLPLPHPEPAIFVPSNALTQQGGLTAVLVVRDDHHAEVRYVAVGRKSGDQVQVLSGLKSGERILALGNLASAGRIIEVRP